MRRSCGYAGQPAGRRRSGTPSAAGRGPAADRGDRDARHDDDRRRSAAFLGIGPERTAKAAFFMAGDGRLITAIVRGDHDVNETKLVNAVKAIGGLRPATVDEIQAAGMEPGYGSPIGAHDTFVVVDELVGALAEPRRRREPGRLPPAATSTSAATSRPTSSPTSTNAREGDPCPTCGHRRCILRNGHRGRQHLQARDALHDGARGDLPRRGRPGPPDRHGLVRDRRSAATSPASSRPTTTRRGSSGRPRWRPTRPTSSSIGATKEPAGRRARRARSTTLAAAEARPARSCGTTATSRRA